MMRDHVNGKWGDFHPKTNIFWLHYLLDKLIGEVPYKSLKAAVHKTNLRKLKALKAKILEYNSAKEYVQENGVLKSS